MIEAGAGYIDEYPYLIGKASCVYRVPDTNNLHGIPDTNMVNIGCHYFDWNYAYGPLKSDLYQDKIVNFVDFAFLAAGWLKIYDMDDLVTMADEWMEIAEPNIQLNIAGDANNGFVEVGADSYSPDTQRIFLYVDGQYAGEIFGFWDGDTLGIDVSKFGGGEHQLKAIGVDSACQVTCSNITSTEFACPLNYCLLPSNYEPNKPLHFSAFNPSAGDVSVNVYADCGNLVWSQTYSGNSFWGSIPAEITSQHKIDYIIFDKSGGGSIMKMSDLPMDPVEPPPSEIRALIILPDLYLRTLDFRQISQVQAAFEARGIGYAKLSGGNATYDKIKSYAKNIKYMYIDAHGNYRLNGVLRTVVYLSSGPAVSMKKSELLPSEVPPWCVSLTKPGGRFWEEMADSFYFMGFTSLEYVQFDTCWSGRLTINSDNQLVEGQPGQFDELPPEEGLLSDLSLALGMHESIFETRAYQGWYDEFKSRVWPLKSKYQQWTQDMWERLSAGDTVGEALTIAIGRQSGSSDPNTPVNTFRFKGQGDIPNIQLVGN